jgi:polyhydroxyalkanoate synthesis regulator phasin
MKRFEIFRAGTHTDSSGRAREFNEQHVRAAVEAYDPALHEAPIVVGHPATNGPAYGWIKSLHFDEGRLVIEADPHQVDAAFGEMVQAGRFKKRSASFYMPDAPGNPSPGVYYLRHVGFLGAQPPAVKGLKEVAFGDAEAGVIEFAEIQHTATLVANMARRMREWIISKFSIEEADQVLPDYVVSGLEEEARTPPAAEDKAPGMFTETDEEPDMKELEQARARITELEAQIAALEASATDLSEQGTALAAREAAIAEREAAIDRQSVEARIAGLVSAGKVLPAEKAAAISFSMSLSDVDQVVSFGEGETAINVTQREHYLRQLEARPKLVNLGEAAAPDGSGEPQGAGDPTQVAHKARKLVTDAEAEGRRLSFTEAVANVMAADNAGAE